MLQKFSRYIRNAFTLGNDSVEPSPPWGFLVNNNDTDSGIFVDRYTALGLSPFYRGTDLISSTVGRTDLPIYHGQNRDKAVEHPAYYTLNYAVNDLMSAYAWKQTMIANAVIFGNSYSVIDKTETPYKLYLLDPEATTQYVSFDGPKPVVSYATQIGFRNITDPSQVMNAGQSATYTADQIIHVKGFCDGIGLKGAKLIDVARNAIGAGLAAQAFSNLYFRHAGTVGGTVEFPPGMNPAQQKDFKEQFNRERGNGIWSSLKWFFGIAGLKIEPWKSNAQEAQLVEAMQHNFTVIANLLGLPASKLGALVNVSYGSLTQDEQNIVNDCYDKWFTSFETELNMKLLRYDEQQDYYIEFCRESLIASDVQTKIPLIIQQYQTGLISWEEARALMNRPTTKDNSQTWKESVQTIPDNKGTTQNG